MSSFRCLDLPTELRVEIYEILLTSYCIHTASNNAYGTGRAGWTIGPLRPSQHLIRTSDLDRGPFESSTYWVDARCNTAILATCRKCYSEGLSLLYAKNNFIMELPSYMYVGNPPSCQLPPDIGLHYFMNARIELQVREFGPFPGEFGASWDFLAKMPKLNRLQILVTFYDRDLEREARRFGRESVWRQSHYKNPLMNLVRSIPKGLKNKVVWGLETKYPHSKRFVESVEGGVLLKITSTIQDEIDAGDMSDLEEEATLKLDSLAATLSDARRKGIGNFKWEQLGELMEQISPARVSIFFPPQPTIYLFSCTAGKGFVYSP